MGTDLVVGNKKELLESLNEMESGISRGLPKNIPFGRVVNCALTAIMDNKALRNCSRLSFVKALVESVNCGLEPNTPLNQAYLIPYGNTVKLIPGYQGLITLAYRSGNVAMIDCEAVYEDDYFKYKKGSNPNIDHEPDLTSKNRGKDNILYVYSCVWIAGSPLPIMTVMTKDDIEMVRARSKAKRSGTPWDTDYAEMAKKTVLKRALKLVPKSAEQHDNLAHVINLDNQAETGEEQTLITGDDALIAEFEGSASPEPEEQ